MEKNTAYIYIYIYIYDYLSTIKSIHDKPTANIIFNSETLKEFPLRSGTRQGHLLFTFIQYSFGNQQKQSEKEMKKAIQIGKEEVKLSLFADNMIQYTENPEDATQKQLELINKSC